MQRLGMRMPPKEMESQSYHQKYLNLKKKFKALLYENESFQEELRKSQRKLLKISRDKSFLLDRLLKYENVETSASDSDGTVTSDTDGEFQTQILTTMKKCPPYNKNVSVKNGKNLVRKKAHSNTDNQESFPSSASMNNMANEVKKKKSRKAAPPKAAASAAEAPKLSVKIEPISIGLGDGHMTSEEIERHLEAKQSLRDLMPEKTPLTLPIEIFSNDPSEMEC